MTIPGYHNYSFDLPLLREYKQHNLPILFDHTDQYDSFEDWPWPLLYKEFDAHYPSSLYILTIRKDPETWFDSICRHARLTGSTYEAAICHFAGRPHQLLVIWRENGDGWDKLCPFLKADFPSLPFSHMNRNRIPSAL